MAPTVAALIGAVKSGVALEVRANVSTPAYLEAVLTRDHLPQCEAALRAALGEPAKPFGGKSALAPDVRELVDRIGGVRPNQCVFLAAADGGGTVYAALWPWQSDASRITLKLGLVPPS